MEDKNINDELIQISAFDNYVLASMSKGLLEENEIDCFLQDEHIVTIDPFLSNAVGGIKLMVKKSEGTKAIEIIKQAERNYVASISCPKCKENKLAVFEKTSTPTSLGKILLNKFLYGQIATYFKKYQCSNCFYISDELPINNE